MAATRRGRPPGSLARFKCSICGEVELATGGSLYFRCVVCKALPGNVFGSELSTGKVEAMRRVARAIREGQLPHPRGLRCADCAGPAREYEHRDYNKPLAVEPICRRCNLRRGPAVPQVAEVEKMLARGLAPYRLRRNAERMLRLMGRPTAVLAGMPPKLGIEHWRAFWPASAAA